MEITLIGSNAIGNRSRSGISQGYNQPSGPRYRIDERIVFIYRDFAYHRITESLLSVSSLGREVETAEVTPIKSR